MPQEISAENSALLETGGFVNGLQIQHCCIDCFAAVAADRDARKCGDSDIVSNSGSAIYFHLSLFDKSVRVLRGGCFFRKDRYRRAGVNDEVQRFADAVNIHFAAEKSARRGSHWNINTRS